LKATEYAIQIENLVKKYNHDITALDGVSIKIKKGDVVGYVGPNGSGKTTTIKILTNLLNPTSGHAYINGVDVNKYPKESLQSVGALIEVPGVYDYLTPHEVLTYFGKVHRMNNKEIDKRIKEVLDLVRLSAWEYKKIGSFSTGMQRRLAIAQSILHDPEILILDEPVIGLDPKGIKDIRELIKRFQSENMTVFLSSHLLQEVSEICDSVIFLDNGKIVAYDSVKNIKNRVKIKSIDVKFLNPLSKEKIDKIKSIEFIDGIKVVNGIVRIDFDGKPKTSSQILSKLVSFGFEIVSYAPESVSLEDFYVSIMGDARGVK
jgi:ABC-2 type transport system ATP-binding protein